MQLHILILLRLAAVIKPFGFKVSEKLPTNVEICFLKNETIRSNRPEMGCVTVCKNTPLCLLACAKENGDCRLYSANVSPWWKGVDDGSEETKNSVCYSTWAERPDLIFSSLPIASSSLLYNSRLEDITGGYSCSTDDVNVIYIFHTLQTDNPWVVIDLQAYHWVRKIIFQVRKKTRFEILFENVEVRVGSYNDPMNFINNSLLMYFKGRAASGEIVKFEQKNALYGRYVSVQSYVENSCLTFYQMKIIPEI